MIGWDTSKPVAVYWFRRAPPMASVRALVPYLDWPRGGW